MARSVELNALVLVLVVEIGVLVRSEFALDQLR